MLKRVFNLVQKVQVGMATCLYRMMLARNSENVAALSSLGQIELERNDGSAALELIERAIKIMPNNPALFVSRGIAFGRMARFNDALDNYDRALAINPDDAQALKNRGDALCSLKRFGDALDSCDRALAIQPNDAQALKNRGDALVGLKRVNNALASYDRALAIKPDDARALKSRGDALLSLKRFGEAVDSYDRVLMFNPSDTNTLNSRAHALLFQGRADKAIACYRNAIAIRPDLAALRTNLIFALNFDPSASAATKQRERALYGELLARQFSARIRPHTNDRQQNRRLRIGYVSSHFRDHASAYAFGGVVLHHDPAHFEVICYSDAIVEDNVTGHFRGRADRWHCTARLSDDRLAELIREDGIDILVDLVGHLKGNRLGVFARKPAPIQVTAWGEPTGTGLKTIDYLFADPVLVPDCEKALLAEGVVNLPNFLGYWQSEQLPPPGPLPALRQGHVTFGSFSRLEKLSKPTICAWASILRKVPTARLVLKASPLGNPSERARISEAFATQGVSAERLTLLGFLDRASHFATYQSIDIALDTFPHSGGMTTLDALWMGIPVVTWAGETISARLATANLAALKLTDFIADSPDSYVNLAVAKASNLVALSLLRANLRALLADSEFGDGARYSRAVEREYREMWRRWCSVTSHVPADFEGLS